MASMSKPQARLVKEDRISALPHALICHILSFLPTMCAVRTAVLSRTWKKMWISLPCLDFDDQRDLFTSKNDCYGSDRFTKLVNRALFSRDSSDIQKLCLAISYPKNVSHIDDWICTAVTRNVAELDFLLTDETNGETSFQMPRSVFMSKTLKVLKVWSFGEFVTYDPPASGCFQSLKFLHVSVANPDEGSMEKLFSYCPVLENLTIDGFIDNGDGYKFKVYAPELKTLRISLDERYEHENSFYINATSLENLELEQVGLSNYFLENAKHVVNARIAFRALCEEERSLFPNRAISLLAGISNVRNLSLSAHCLEVSISQNLFFYAIFGRGDYRMK